MAGCSVARERQQEALQLLGAGHGCSELVSVLAARWGCSRRTARRHVYRAYDELVSDLAGVEGADMLATIINRLETIARKAEAAGQYAAAVGACRQLGELVMHSRYHRPRFGSFKG